MSDHQSFLTGNVKNDKSEGVLDISTSRQGSPSRAEYDNNYGYPETAEDQVRVWDYLRSIRKHFWLICGAVLLLTTAAAIFMARKPDVYEGKARIQVDWESPSPASGALKSSAILISNPANDPTYFNTQLQILSSPGLLGRVAKTLDLESSPSFFGGPPAGAHSTWDTLLRMALLKSNPMAGSNRIPDDGNWLRQGKLTPPISRSDLALAESLVPYVTALQQGLTIEPVQETRVAIKETRLIDISFDHMDPRVAARVANAVAETFVLSNLERKNEAVVASGQFLQQRIAELQMQIRGGEQQLVEYAKNHQILSLDGSQNTVVERLAGLNRQLLEAENDRKLAEGAYTVAEKPGAASALAESGTREADAQESKLAELRQRRAQLLVDYTVKAPEVRELDQQIEVLEKHIHITRTHATDVLLTNLETKYQQAKSREDALRAAFDQQRAETLTQNEAAINYRIKQQEIATNKDLLDGLLQRAKENDVQLAGIANNIHVDSFALLPREPVAPRRLRIIGLVFLLSIGLACGVAIFIDSLDTTIHTREDSERTLGLPMLAEIPQLSSKSGRRFLNGRARHQGSMGVNTQALILREDSSSQVAELYRQLRTSILLSTAGRAPRTLLVTSTDVGEGKTTTAVNVAVSFAQMGAKVLLIDGDMRRPRLHNLFHIQNERGLSHYLSSEMSEAELDTLIVKDETNGLSILPSGPLPPNPAELAGSEQMRRLISHLQSAFTYIIIDSPPISLVTDAVLISTIVDGTLFVVQEGKCSRESLKISRQRLHQVGAKVVGVVLNKVDARAREYRYNSYHRAA